MQNAECRTGMVGNNVTCVLSSFSHCVHKNRVSPNLVVHSSGQLYDSFTDSGSVLDPYSLNLDPGILLNPDSYPGCCESGSNPDSFLWQR